MSIHRSLADVGVALQERASLVALTDDVVKTSAIEGEQLDVLSVRSSVARRLGLDIGALLPANRHVEGVVDMVLDATQRHHEPLTAERLFGWHAALFPTGFASLTRIRVGAWRNDASGPMQVVSGPVQRQRVHFEAPPAERLPAEMDNFLAWANAATGEPAVIKAGLAHLWLVTVHPFDDGNGRTARAVGDLFLATLLRAVGSAHQTLDSVLRKTRFWQRRAQTPMNERQVVMLNRVLDGFEGRLTSGQWARLTKCSPDTALRDLQQLLALGVLRKMGAGGRSTAYELVHSEHS